MNDCIQFGGFLEKNNFGNKKTIPKNGLDILSRNDASSNPKIRILKFLLDFLSENDASSILRNWIFCPEFTVRG